MDPRLLVLAGLSAIKLTEDSSWRGGWRWTCRHGNESALHYTKLECGCELTIRNALLAQLAPDAPPVNMRLDK
jgi:hypothetical protein